MNSTDDWGSVGSAPTDEEVEQPKAVPVSEGIAASTTPLPQQQPLSSFGMPAMPGSFGLGKWVPGGPFSSFGGPNAPISFVEVPKP